MPAAITPFLMFTGNAEAAATLYVAVFGGRIVALERRGDGKLQRCEIEIAGQRVRLFDSPVEHAFGFTPAISLFVDCKDGAELEAAAAVLADGGKYLMPPNDYGFSQRFCWLEDRHGVSWQLNLP
jgi:predicted 3-demethylubiquinone-9 3-methyltransferase (glyoxalase superfamily)